MKERKTLICLIGKSPQILTEALYWLEYKQKNRYDKIIVITTNECLDDATISIPKAIKEFEIYYNVKITENLNFYSEIDELYEDNGESSLTKLIFRIVNNEKLIGNIIHAVISGGRKNMSVDLALAMTVFSNDKDKMYHVVASPKFTETKKFFPLSPADEKELNIFEKPYIRINVSNIKNASSIEQIMNYAQEQLNNRIELPPLEIYINNREIKINNSIIQMQPQPFAVYLFFAKHAGKFIEGGKKFADRHLKEIWDIYNQVSSSYGHMQRVVASSLRQGQINIENLLKAISTIKNQIIQALNNDILSDFYIINTVGNYANKKYGIKLQKNKVKIYK